MKQSLVLGDGFPDARHDRWGARHDTNNPSLRTERSVVKQSLVLGDGLADARHDKYKNKHFIFLTMNRQYFIYIMTNKNNNVLYVGVTNNLIRRVYEHRNKLIEGFTQKYNVIKLAYYEVFNDSLSAITREKQIKGGSRQKKLI